MDGTLFTDRLEILGIAAGAFLVLTGLGTIAGLPWQTAQSVLVGVVQVMGALLTIAVGAGLVWVTQDERPLA